MTRLLDARGHEGGGPNALRYVLVDAESHWRLSARLAEDLAARVVESDDVRLRLAAARLRALVDHLLELERLRGRAPRSVLLAEAHDAVNEAVVLSNAVLLALSIEQVGEEERNRGYECLEAILGVRHEEVSRRRGGRARGLALLIGRTLVVVVYGALLVLLLAAGSR